MPTLTNRVKLPAQSSVFSKRFNIAYRDLLSTNPKTEKSLVQTYILHLAPADISGTNVCPGAGNCKQICLHFAGNPVYMKGKQSARIRRTLAFLADKPEFCRLLVCAILSKINLSNGDPIAVRLNGTSDILWEDVDFNVSPEFSTFCEAKFGQALPIGKRNIFEVFRNIGANVIFYDYTKIKHNWAECKRLGYHLTFSYDGASNRQNVKLAAQAIANGVNVAAAFNIKKGQPLPPVSGGLGRTFKVVDGDLTDYRPSDPNGYHIIGLRFKLPHGVKYTEAQKSAFCIA